MKSKFELHRHHKFFLGFAALVLAGSGGGAWFAWTRCQELDEESTAVGHQIRAAKDRIDGLKELEEDVIVLRENVQNYVRVLPSDAEVDDFYRTLDDFRKEAGITITSLTSTPSRTKLQNPVFDKAEYKLAFKASYAQFLRFIGRLENHQRFVSIADIRINAAEKNERSEKGEKAPAEPQHDFELTTVTYVYTGEDLQNAVKIPDYDRKKAKLAAEIEEARHELALARVELSTNLARRDPFVDPRPRHGQGGPNDSGKDEQRAVFNRILASLQDAHRLCDQVQGAQNVIREMELRVQAIGALTQIQAQVDDATGRGLVTDAALRRDWDKRILPELARLRQRVGRGADGTDVDVARSKVRGTLTQMEQTYAAGEFDKCVNAYEMARNLGAGESADPSLLETQKRMDDLYRNAQVMVEFGKKPIKVSGMVVNPDHESVAIINGVVWRAGDAIEDDLYLLEVHADRLLFEFKGIPLTLDL